MNSYENHEYVEHFFTKMCKHIYMELGTRCVFTIIFTTFCLYSGLNVIADFRGMYSLGKHRDPEKHWNKSDYKMKLVKRELDEPPVTMET